jgi:hypothetical protein
MCPTALDQRCEISSQNSKIFLGHEQEPWRDCLIQDTEGQQISCQCIINSHSAESLEARTQAPMTNFLFTIF